MSLITIQSSLFNHQFASVHLHLAMKRIRTWVGRGDKSNQY